MLIAKRFLCSISLLLLVCICLIGRQVYSQDEPPGESPAPTEDIIPPTATPSPIPTPTATETPLPPPTEVPTAIVTTPTIDYPTPTVTASETVPPDTDIPIPEVTAVEISSTSTMPDESSLTVTPAETPIAEQTETITPTPEATIETPDATIETLTPTSTMFETALPTMTLPPTMTAETAPYRGVVHYQNHVPDDSGIHVLALDQDRTIVDETVTDSSGAYTLTVPVEQPFILRITADRYRAVEIQSRYDDVPPEIELAGGDLDGDGCIGAADLGLLTVSFELPNSTAADITGDGITDDVDLAILAGNYTSTCGQPPLASGTAAPTLQITLDSSTLTPTPLETASVETDTPVPQTSPIPATVTPIIEPIITVTAESAGS